jgi:hypothetical protein
VGGIVDTEDVPLSESPNQLGNVTEPATAEQVDEQVSSAGGISQWVKHLKNLEQRQERIEDLLMQIAKDIKNIRE